MKKYESILSLRLSREEKEAIDQIAKEDIRISSGTSTGAVRKMIMHWRPITEELRKVKAECLDLYQQNEKYAKIIDGYCRSMDEMQKMVKRRKGKDQERWEAESEMVEEDRRQMSPEERAREDVKLWRQEQGQGKDHDQSQGIGD